MRQHGGRLAGLDGCRQDAAVTMPNRAVAQTTGSMRISFSSDEHGRTHSGGTGDNADGRVMVACRKLRNATPLLGSRPIRG